MKITINNFTVVYLQHSICEKWTDTSMGQNLSPRQESNPWPPEHQAGTLSTELWELMESKVI